MPVEHTKRPRPYALRALGLCALVALGTPDVGCTSPDYFPDEQTFETATRLRMDDATVWGRAEVATTDLELARTRAIDSARVLAGQALALEPDDPRLDYFGRLWGASPRVFVRRDAGLIDCRVAYQPEDLAAELASLPDVLLYGRPSDILTDITLELFIIDARPPIARSGDFTDIAPPPFEEDVTAVLLPSITRVVANHGGTRARVDPLEARELELEAATARKVAFVRHMPKGTPLPLRLRKVSLTYRAELPGQGGIALIEVEPAGAGIGATIGRKPSALSVTPAVYERLRFGEGPMATEGERHVLDWTGVDRLSAPFLVTDTKPAVIDVSVVYSDAERPPVAPLSVVLGALAGSGLTDPLAALLDVRWAGTSVLSDGSADIAVECEVDLTRVHGFVISGFSGSPIELMRALEVSGALGLGTGDGFVGTGWRVSGSLVPE